MMGERITLSRIPGSGIEPLPHHRGLRLAREGSELAPHDYIVDTTEAMDRDQRERLRRNALHGWEIVDSAARLCAMNLYLHGIGGSETNITVDDSLRGPSGGQLRPGADQPALWPRRL